MSAEPDDEVAALLPCCADRGRSAVSMLSESQDRSQPLLALERSHLVDAESCSCGDDRGGRTDVECVVAVSSRPDNVAHGAVVASMVRDVDLDGVRLHDAGALCDDRRFAVLAGQPQRCEERSDLGRVGSIVLCEVIECEPGVVERERLRVDDELLEQRRERFGRVNVTLLFVYDRRLVAVESESASAAYRSQRAKGSSPLGGIATDPIIWTTDGSVSAVPCLCESIFGELPSSLAVESRKCFTAESRVSRSLHLALPSCRLV